MYWVYGRSGYGAHPFIGNAPVAGEAFQWHIDADPLVLPGYGYNNRHAAPP
jgi:hypothetical protein